jgi:hypothetical protein
MTQAVLGVGCLAGGAPLAHAAQWSFAPQANVGVDNDSNRYLEANAPASQSGFVNPSAEFDWSNDTSKLSLSPWLMWQQISTKTYASLHSESLNGEYDWNSELGQLAVQGSVADFSTLATDIPDSGLVAPGINRRTYFGSASYSHLLSERRTFIAQFSWLDVNYFGSNSQLLNLLSAYKYATVSLGEKFILDPSTSLTPTIFDNQVISELTAGNSRESGMRLDFNHSFTERISIKAYAGGSQQALQDLYGYFITFQGLVPAYRPETRISGLGGFVLTLATERGHLDLTYANSLQPYSGGVLAQRQSLTLSGMQSVTEKIDVSISGARIQNNHSAVQLGIDRAYYDTATLGLDWHFAETLRLHSEAGVQHAPTLSFGPYTPTVPLTEWHVALSLNWTPLPLQHTS